MVRRKREIERKKRKKNRRSFLVVREELFVRGKKEEGEKFL